MAPNAEPDRLPEDEASDWLARRLAGPLSRAEQRDFVAWLNCSPAHQAAWRHAETTWKRLEAVGREPGSLHDDIAHLLQQPRYTPAHRRPSDRRHWRLIAAMAAGIAIVAAGASLWLGNPVLLLRADYAAAPAQNRSVELPDGSRAELAPGAAIALNYNDAERRVTLLAGSGYFTVAPLAADSGARPFVVVSENGTTRALGTQFAVDVRPGHVRVAVTEHAVEVAAGTGGTLVQAGRAVSYTRDGSIAILEDVDVANATAWHRGRLIFDQQPVSEVIAELNRYRRGRILVADPALAERRISGVFNTDDIDGAVRAIASELDAEARLLPLFALLY